jgi:hypothetical protein
MCILSALSLRNFFRQSLQAYFMVLALFELIAKRKTQRPELLPRPLPRSEGGL